MSPLERRLTKLEQCRQQNDVGCKLDQLLEKAGTSRAVVMTGYGSLQAFRNCFEAQGQASSASFGEWRP